MSRIVPNIELQGQAGAVGSNNEWKPGQVVVTGSRRGVLTNSQSTVATGTAVQATSTTIGFYGTTPIAQVASVAAMQTSNVISSNAFNSSYQSSIVAALQEVMNVLYAYGLYSTH